MLISFSLTEFFDFKERITVVTSSGVVGVKKKNLYFNIALICLVFGYRRNKFRQVFPILY